jgi:hypothetical protein
LLVALFDSFAVLHGGGLQIAEGNIPLSQSSGGGEGCVLVSCFVHM